MSNPMNDLSLELDGVQLPDGKYMFFVPFDYEVQYVSGNTVLVRRDDLYQKAAKQEETK